MTIGGDSKKSPITAIVVGVTIALLAGGSAPWWWEKLFSPNPSPTPTPISTPRPKPVCPERVVEVGPIALATNASNASIVAGDGEIHSDDWTSVELAYTVKKQNGNRDLELSLTWYAQERNRNKTKGDTRFKSSKSFSIFSVDASCPGSVIKTIEGLVLVGRAEQYYRGEVHNFVSFPDTGSLRNIKVQFDGPGRHDEQRQALEAEVPRFTINLSASK